MLLINELLPENPLLIIQVKEHTQVLVQLTVLLSLNDPLDLSLLRHFLSNDLDFSNLFELVFFLFEGSSLYHIVLILNSICFETLFSLSTVRR